MKNTEFYEEVECPQCYFNTPCATEEIYNDFKKNPMCSFCRGHPFLSERYLLERQIDILEETQASNFPKVLRLFFNVFENKIDELWDAMP